MDMCEYIKQDERTCDDKIVITFENVLKLNALFRLNLSIYEVTVKVLLEKMSFSRNTGKKFA